MDKDKRYGKILGEEYLKIKRVEKKLKQFKNGHNKEDETDETLNSLTEALKEIFTIDVDEVMKEIEEYRKINVELILCKVLNSFNTLAHVSYEMKKEIAREQTNSEDEYWEKLEDILFLSFEETYDTFVEIFKLDEDEICRKYNIE